jgi:hypothetical protein
MHSGTALRLIVYESSGIEVDIGVFWFYNPRGFARHLIMTLRSCGMDCFIVVLLGCHEPTLKTYGFGLDHGPMRGSCT